MKKLICWLTLLCLALAPTLCALAEAVDGHTIEEKKMNFYYYYDPDAPVGFSVYFIDGSDVPYLALSDWPSVVDGGSGDADALNEYLDALQEEDLSGMDDDELALLAELVAMEAADDASGSRCDLTFSMAGSVGTLSRSSGYSVDFDCDADTIHFLDYDAFMRRYDDTFMMDMIDGVQSVDEDGNVRYFARSANSYERYGKEVVINAGDYGIDFVAEGGECYVPMQTLSDILMSYDYTNIYYNGESAVVSTPGAFEDADYNLTPLGKRYYSVKPHERSEAMARFTYNELCMALDTLYGLKENHNITSFRDLAVETGLAEGLTSTNPVEADAALYQLLWLHLDDMHSGYSTPSAASGHGADDPFGTEYGDGQSYMRHDMQCTIYENTRDAVRPEGIPAYEEIGNTAYITFDRFDAVPSDVDYYEDPPTVETEADLNSLDTMGLMIYAYQQITRDDSPIENVVMDLSCNGGGDSRAAVYAVASFLGVCTISARNTFSGALVTGNYLVDLNLDGTVDEDDRLLTEKNLYCLESPHSFSCGNLVPCAFKASNKVTLLGRTSGGGACIVQPLSTADGSGFQISGATQLSFLKNGAFYDIDKGADPDFPLMKPASFYDRETLTEYINSIR